MSKLIIVGNGFDLAHGLKTSYNDFSKKYKNNKYMNEFMFLLEQMKENENYKYDNWNDFENHFEEIANRNCYCEVETQNGQYLRLMNSYNELFKHISELLFEYLSTEVDIKKIKIIDNLKAEFTKDSMTFSYNYTDTAFLYTNNVKFIHGSLKEDEFIILGYANEGPQDLAATEHRKFKKFVLMEKLNYLRYLKSKNILNVDDFLLEFEPHLNCMFSGKGGYCEFSDNSLKHASKVLKEYAEGNNYSPHLDRLDYKSVKQLVVMGHGLKSDLLEFECMARSFIELESIVLYSHVGEKKEDLDYKIKTLKDIFKKENIEIKYF